MPPRKVKKVMTLPINVIFGHLQVSDVGLDDGASLARCIDFWMLPSSDDHRYNSVTRIRVSLLFNFIRLTTSHASPTLHHRHSTTTSTIQQKKNRVKIWLYEDTRMTIEGQIIGFDEYMNFVLDGAEEVDTKSGKKTEVGRILLKGDAITLMQEA
jgi:small nuclear ribonucleoprotein E